MKNEKSIIDLKVELENNISKVRGIFTCNVAHWPSMYETMVLALKMQANRIAQDKINFEMQKYNLDNR